MHTVQENRQGKLLGAYLLGSAHKNILHYVFVCVCVSVCFCVCMCVWGLQVPHSIFTSCVSLSSFSEKF